MTSSVTRRMTASDSLPEALFGRLNGRSCSVHVHGCDDAGGTDGSLALSIPTDL